MSSTTHRDHANALREQALRCIYPNFTTLEAYDKQQLAKERKLDDARGRVTSHPLDWFYDEFGKETTCLVGTTDSAKTTAENSDAGLQADLAQGNNLGDKT